MATYLEKEIAIIERLEAAGYEAFAGSRDEALGFMEKNLGALAGCADAAIGTRHARAGNGEHRGRGTAMDRHFEGTLDDAAAALDALDRLSAALGLESFAGIDTSDRDAVAGVATGFAAEMFRTGTKGMVRQERHK